MMLNPVASEALYSATYVDNYIDSVENLPDDVQRHLSRIRDIDVQYRSLLRDVDHYYDLWRSLQNTSATNLNRRSRAIHRMQQSLIQAQELGDEKMQIVNLLQELIDHKTRQLDTDQKNLDIKEELQQQRAERELEECGIPTAPKQPRTQSPARSGGVTGVVGSEQPSLPANGSAIGVSVGGERQYNSNSNSGKDHNTNSFSGFAGSVSSGGGGGSTPNSERSGHASNGTTGSGTAANGGGGIGSGAGAAGAGNTSGSNLISSSDTQRAGSKRSRRRNENNVSSTSGGGGGNMEMGGNESNSANEAGGSNGNAVQRSSSGASGSAQKRNSTGNQSGSVAVGSAASGVAGGASGSGGAASAVSSGGNNAGKKKKRKARGAQSTSAQASAREDTPPPDPIDPDEPTYCVCNQISFGEMILCDNDLCPIEWFHFSCVSLVLKPKGKWFCPNCRGDRPNVMKPKAQFLKELERYNKEKEEKT